jgi:hypothetical protein
MTRAPLLWPSIATPSAEIVGIKDLNAHLTGLKFSIEAWEAGLLLYQTAKQPQLTISRSVARRWLFIGCTQCILELYHLRARLEKIQSVQLRKCPSLHAAIDMLKLRSSRKKLDEYFPDIESLRHATAHSGENESHPEDHAPDGLYALSGFREADVYSTPYKGCMRRLAITNQSLELITKVVEEFFSSFETAAAELEKQGHLE